MKRIFFSELSKWIKKSDRMPLIIRGARQTGKSKGVQLFANEEKLDLIEINLERKTLRSLENGDVELREIINDIEVVTSKKIGANSLIFFDEIQAAPKLVSMLRYFYEEMPELKIVAAGSLLELAIRDEKISFPVGRVEFLHIGPMTFYEFLEALDEIILLEEIKKENFSLTISDRAQKHFFEYLNVGGMPKAVNTYVNTRSLIETREVQEQIFQTFKNDFPKYAKRSSIERIDRIFENSVFNLGKKVIFQNLDKESKSRDIRKVLEILFDAKVLLPTFHSECSGIPIQASVDHTIFKMYFLDIGLVCQKLDVYINSEHFSKNKNQAELVNTNSIQSFLKGILLEQFCAQHLNQIDSFKKEPGLLFWLRDKAANKAEVDFVKQYTNKVYPIEIKSSLNSKAKSLSIFLNEKKFIEHAIKLCLDINNTSHNSFAINNDAELNGNDLSNSTHSKIIHYPIWAIENLPKKLSLNPDNLV